MNHLKNISTDGYDSTVAGVNELLEKKYLWRRACGGNSPGGWEYYVYQYPQLEDPFRNGNSPTREFPESGKPATSKERVEVVKKDLSSKDEDGFVADAPKTMATDLFPTDSISTHSTTGDSLGRSSMDSRPSESTDYMARFKAKANRLMNRRDSTPWSKKEMISARPHLNTCDEDWAVLEKYYACRGQDGFYHRTSMLTLLNNFAGEIDKAKSKFPPAPSIPDEKKDPVAAGKYWANVKPNE